MPIEPLYLCDKPVGEGTCQRLGGHDGECSADARTEFDIEVDGELTTSGNVTMRVLRNPNSGNRNAGDHSTRE